MFLGQVKRGFRSNARPGGEGDSRSLPVPGPGEGDDGDVVEINFLSGLRTDGVQMLKRSAICSRISRRTPIAQTVSERRWRMSSFAARVVLLRMMW